MPFIFLDEIAVEPVAYTGKEIQTQIHVPNSVHKVYSGIKLNVPFVSNFSRYINNKRKSRFINLLPDKRFPPSP